MNAAAAWRADWHARMKAGLARFGAPVYGLPAALGHQGTLSMYGRYQVSVTYRLAGVDSLEVTTGRRPLGGTRNLVMQLFTRSAPQKPELPWQLSLTERNVWIPVEGTRTQFHVIEASTGDWIAAGGFLKRHLLLAGTEGFRIEEVVLSPVGVNFGIALPGESDEDWAARQGPS